MELLEIVPLVNFNPAKYPEAVYFCVNFDDVPVVYIFIETLKEAA
jgi:hypothetical protein